MRKRRWKWLIRRLFVPSPDWPSILAGNWPRSSGLGAGSLISLCKYLELTGCPRGALEPCLNYLPKRWGGLVLSADSPSEDLIKVINLPKHWGDLMLSVDSPPEETIWSYLKFAKALGCIKRRTPPEDISLSGDPLWRVRYLVRGLPCGELRVKRRPLFGRGL